MKHRLRQVLIAVLLGSTLLLPVGAGATATLDIGVAKAPITGDGLAAGGATDFVLTIVDRDPAVPGITLYEGAEIRLTLPPQFVNVDTEAPLDVIVLQGWPQSPILPFPAAEWDPATNTVTATAGFTWEPDPPAAPGPKQFHFNIPGFVNPPAGLYEATLEIQPDPNSDHVMYGTAVLPITAGIRANINPVSVINGEPPPPFPNAIYQTVALGDDVLPWGFYLWAAGGAPMVGVDLEYARGTHWLIQDGAVVGQVAVSGPPFADYTITTDGPSVEVAAFVSGLPTALLVAQFAASAPGEYAINWKLLGGTNQTMYVTIE